jgi:plastocyanin
MSSVPRAFLRPTALLLLVLALAGGCRRRAGEAALEFPPVTVKPPPAEGAARVHGVVRFEGTPPRRRPIAMSDAVCQSHHPEPVLDEAVVVGEGGGLRDVLVHVVSGLGDWVLDHERQAAVMDQAGCMYRPRVLAVRTFQPVRFTTQDRTIHNVNTSRARQQKGFNLSLSAPGQEIVHQFREAELRIPVTCDIHPWMQGYLHVLPHAWFAVTGEDGRFELPLLPPGRYEVEALHPTLGHVRREVAVEPGQPVGLDFTLAR